VYQLRLETWIIIQTAKPTANDAVKSDAIVAISAIFYPLGDYD